MVREEVAVERGSEPEKFPLIPGGSRNKVVGGGGDDKSREGAEEEARVLERHPVSSRRQ